MSARAMGVLEILSRDMARKEATSNLYAGEIRKAHDDVAALLEWAEFALECISASKHPNTHAELRAAIQRANGGAV